MVFPPEGERKRSRAPQRFAGKVAEALINDSHIRFHAAVILALAFIALLTFFILPVHRVRVAVDGAEKTVLSRQQGASAVLEQAQVELLPGDAVQETGDSGETVLAVKRAVPVELESDGETLTWSTLAQTIGGVLAEAGTTLGPFDSVLRSDLPASVMDPIDSSPRWVASRLLRLSLPPGSLADEGDGVRIAIRRAMPFTVIEDGEALELESSQPTVGLALRQRGISLGPGDLVFPSAASALTAGLEVHVERARRVDLSLPDLDTVIFTQADTVEEVLSEAGVDLAPTERVEPSEEAPVADDMEVSVLSMSEESYVESETVYHGTVFDVDYSLGVGEEREVEGWDGTLYREYQVSYENGVEVGRELVSEWYDPAPQDTVVYHGPTVDYRAAAAPASVPEELDVSQPLYVCATWYNAASAGKSPGSPGYGVTATGVPLTKGIVAVDPGVIPLGTHMFIPGYGFGVAADTGGSIVGNIIDLGYPGNVVGDWGNTRCLDIYILNP